MKKSAILKDKYSHDLGNIIQIILGAVEIMAMETNHSEKELLIIKEKCIEAAEHIRNIR